MMPFVEGPLEQLSKNGSRRVTAQLQSLAAAVVGPRRTLGVKVPEAETHILFVVDKWPGWLVPFSINCLCLPSAEKYRWSKRV